MVTATVLPEARLSTRVATRPATHVVPRASRVSVPGDRFEHQADHVADDVMRMPDGRVSAVASALASAANVDATRGPPALRRQCAAGERPVRAKAGADAAPAMVQPDVAAGVDSLRGGGRSLTAAERAFMEPRFGHDFRHVRVHTDTRAARLAQALHAQALTVGHDIAFGAAQLQPGEGGGRRLLAHELAHTLQGRGTTIHRQDAGVDNDTKPRIRLTELGFTGDHVITSVVGGLGGAKGARIDDPDGTEPVWKASTEVSRPVAYTVGTNPVMFARFGVSPPAAQPLGVRVRAMIGNTIVGTVSGLTLTEGKIENAGAGSGMVRGIAGGAPIPGAATVGVTNRRIEFQVHTDDGATWWHAGAALIRFVLTPGTPRPPGGELREDALVAGAQAAAAAGDPTSGVRKLVAEGLQYGGSPPLFKPSLEGDRVMTFFKDTKQYCEEHAFLMRYLITTLGITADVRYLWMGAPDSVWMYVTGTQPGLLPFTEDKTWANFQCDRPAVDMMHANPTFNFHAMTDVGGVLHDPAYDMTGQPGILKHARGATAQVGSSDQYWSAFSNERYVE